MILLRNILMVLVVMALALAGLIWAGHTVLAEEPSPKAAHAPAKAHTPIGLVWQENAMYWQGCFRFAVAPAGAAWQLAGSCYSNARGTVLEADTEVTAEDWQVLRSILEQMTLAEYTEPTQPQPLEAATGSFALQFADGTEARYELPDYDEARETLLAALTMLVEAAQAE